jgi:hypothetical protein
LKWLTIASRLGAATISISPAHAASPPQAWRADQAAVVRGGKKPGDQHPCDRCHRAVERQFAECGVGREFVGRQRLHRHQQGECDRQVEVAAFLQHIGRRQIDRDPLWRQGEAKRIQRRAHPFARFGDRLVGQADDGKGRQPGSDRHLGFDLDDLDPVKRHRANLRGHVLGDLLNLDATVKA